MTRSHLFAFLAGASLVAAIGWARPCPVPQRWKYKIIAESSQAPVIEELRAKRMKAIRTQFQDDAAAFPIAQRDAVNSWLESFAKDGWVFLGGLRSRAAQRIYDEDCLVFVAADPPLHAISAQVFDWREIDGLIAKAAEKIEAKDLAGHHAKGEAGAHSRPENIAKELKPMIPSLIETQLNRLGNTGILLCPIAAPLGLRWDDTGEPNFFVTTPSN